MGVPLANDLKRSWLGTPTKVYAYRLQPALNGSASPHSNAHGEADSGDRPSIPGGIEDTDHRCSWRDNHTASIGNAPAVIPRWNPPPQPSRAAAGETAAIGPEAGERPKEVTWEPKVIGRLPP
jgi:hypothetical protein